MSAAVGEANGAAAPVKPKFQLTVCRGGVTATLEEATETKGKGADKDYMGLITDLNVQDLIKFTNEDWVRKQILLKTKKVLKSLYDEAFDKETKQLDPEKLKRLVETATFTVETIRELNDKIDAKLKEVLAIDASSAEGFTKVTSLLAEIRELKVKKEEKQRTPDEEDEADETPATPAQATGDLSKLTA